MLLASEIFEFCDARVWMFIGIVDHGSTLKALDGKRLMFELERAVRQFAVLVIEVFVYGAGVDDASKREAGGNISIVTVQENFDAVVIDHVSEHSGVSMTRHCLVRVREIAIVGIYSDRKPGSHTCI